MEGARSIMYVGMKNLKYDNVNNVVDRRWHGPGAVCDVSSKLHAEKLLSHPDEFEDVTGLKDNQLLERSQKAVADAAERMRTLRAPTANRQGGTLLEYATEAQIHAELEKRQALRAGRTGNQQSPAAPVDAGNSRIPVTRITTAKDSQFLAVKVTEALETVLGRGNAEDLDERGVPQKSAVEEVMGFTITDNEYAAALGGNAPTDPLDKTADAG